jgi:hypothetical protein
MELFRLNSNVLSFNQFLQIQQAFMPRGGPPPRVGGSAEAFYRGATSYARGERIREVHLSQEGESWTFDWTYAAPLKPAFDPFKR